MLLSRKRRPTFWYGAVRRSLQALGLMVFVASAGADTVHKWVDEKGRVHFGDRPPAAVKTEIQNIESGSGANTIDSGAAAEIEEALQEIGEARRERDAARKKARHQKMRSEKQEPAAPEREAASNEKEDRQEKLREQTGTYAITPENAAAGDARSADF